MLHPVIQTKYTYSLRCRKFAINNEDISNHILPTETLIRIVFCVILTFMETGKYWRWKTSLILGIAAFTNLSDNSIMASDVSIQKYSFNVFDQISDAAL